MTQIAAPPMPQRVICDHTAERAGPTLVAIGGVHGNEPAGIVAAEAVSEGLTDACPMTRGRFVALRGNLAALAVDPNDPSNNPRYLAHDLNRLFKDDAQSPSDAAADPTPDQVQRDALRDALDAIAAESEGPLVVLDLHTTSSDSPPFVAVEDSLPARAFAERFPLPLILGIEEDLKGLLMDEATARLGCVALTVEGGMHDDPNAARTLEAVLWIALEALGLVSPSARTSCGAEPIQAARTAAGVHAHRVYDIRHREPVSTLPYEPDTAVDPFRWVRAHQTRIATQAGADLLAAESGLLFMPNRQRDIRVGDDAYFVVRRVGHAWLRLSAWLRTRAGVHRRLPRVLPGVRPRPGHPHDLLVDPEIAAVFRRELFHLLGYRLVRFEATPGLPFVVRVARAVRLTLHAIGVVVGNLVRRGTADPDHPENASDWIVRRHLLDTDPPREP